MSATRFFMRGFNTITLQYVEWVVDGAPDTTGAQSGVSPSDLTNITINRQIDSAPIESIGPTIGTEPTIKTGPSLPNLAGPGSTDLDEPDGSIYLRNTFPNGSAFIRNDGYWSLLNNGTSSGGSSPTGLAGGDLSGSYPNPTVAKIQGVAILAGTPTNGFVLTYNTSNGRWEATAPSGLITLAGDVTGLATANTVTKIQNVPVLAGTPTNGFILTYISANGRWEATAPSSGGAITLSGDVTGLSNANTVTKIQNVAVLAGTPSNGFVLTYVTANNRWEAAAPASVSTVTLAGDATGPSNNNTVVGVTGTAGILDVKATIFRWNVALTSPLLTQATTSGLAQPFTIQAQTTTQGGQAGGDVILQTGVGPGSNGVVTLITGNTTRVTLNASTLNFNSVDTLRWANTVAAPFITQSDITTASTTAQELYIRAQNATGTGSNGGNLKLSSGSGTLNAGTVLVLTGGTVNTTFASSLVGFSVNTLQFFASGVSNPSLIQENVSATSTNGQPLTIRAQNATGGTSTGGNLVLTSGTGTTAAGNVILQTGGVAAWNVSPTAITMYGGPTFNTGSLAPGVSSPSAPDGSIYLRTVSPNGSLYVRQNGAWVLLGAAGAGGPPSGPAGGDLGGTYPNPIVVGLTGTSSPLSVAIHAANLTWDSGVLAPTIKQANIATNGVNGQGLLVQAQNATGTGSLGGSIFIFSGQGLSGPGSINFNIGGAVSISLLGSGSSGAAVATDMIWKFPNVRFDSTVVSPIVKQDDNVTGGTLGQTLAIRAQNTTAGGSTGGTLSLSSGSGTTTNGTVIVLNGGTLNTTLSTNLVSFNVSTVQFAAGVPNPLFNQANSAGAGQTLTIQSQNSTGSTGGNLSLKTGTGTTAGSMIFQIGNTTNLTLSQALLQWSSGVVSPIINQANAVSGAGTTFTIKAQDGAAANAGGTLLLQAGGSGGTGGSVSIQSGSGATNGNILLNIAATTNLTLSQALLQWGSTIANPTITQSTNAATPGSIFTIRAQAGGAVNSAGGLLTLAGGDGNGSGIGGTITIKSGAGGTAGQISFTLGTTPSMSLKLVSGLIQTLNFSNAVNFGVQIGHDVQTTNTAGNLFTLVAQGGGPGNNAGGLLSLSGGARTGSGGKGGLDLVLGTADTMLSVRDIGPGRRVLGLVGTSTTSNMPANTGDLVIYIANAATAPTTGVPTGGGVLYCEAGALKFLGSSGTVTTLGPA